MCSCSVIESSPALCNLKDCSPPGCSVHGISQARILNWVAISSSRVSSWLRDGTHVSCIGSGFFTTCHLESPIYTGKALLKAVSGSVVVAQNVCCYCLRPSYYTACGASLPWKNCPRNTVGRWYSARDWLSSALIHVYYQNTAFLFIMTILLIIIYLINSYCPWTLWESANNVTFRSAFLKMIVIKETSVLNVQE